MERARLAALPNLARRGGVSAPQICSREEAERELEASAKFGVALVALGEAHYPRRLQMIDDAPPPLLAIRGLRAAYGKIEALKGVQHLDKHGDTHAVLLVKTQGGALDLQTIELP